MQTWKMTSTARKTFLFVLLAEYFCSCSHMSWSTCFEGNKIEIWILFLISHVVCLTLVDLSDLSFWLVLKVISQNSEYYLWYRLWSDLSRPVTRSRSSDNSGWKTKKIHIKTFNARELVMLLCWAKDMNVFNCFCESLLQMYLHGQQTSDFVSPNLLYWYTNL